LIGSAFMKSVRAALRTRTALITLVVLGLALLLYGIAQFGLVNSLPAEQRVERSRDNNRLMITQDKDGCIDMRTLGRSNGIYMSVQPCDKNKNKNQQNPNGQPQQPQQQPPQN
jgi:hypothetical protein